MRNHNDEAKIYSTTAKPDDGAYPFYYTKARINDGETVYLRCRVVDEQVEAVTLNNIGLVYDNLGQRQKALEVYERALPIGRQVGNRTVEAVTCANIAYVYEAEGDLERAIQYMARSEKLMQQVQHPAIEQIRGDLKRLRAKRGC
jgi:tetratricopeptide (TPR) repeat protein